MATRLIFTICSANYFAFAKTLLDSSAKYHADARHVLVLADELALDQLPPHDFEIVLARDLGIDDFDAMHRRYDILEFNTAIKAAAFLFFFREFRANQVVYLDPDIYVLGRMVEVFAALDEGVDAVLTPHCMSPLPEDGKFPSDRDLLRAGAYNLGFLAVRDTETSRRVMDWWHKRLAVYCYNNLDEHLFVDQKWADLLPCLLDRVSILRHEGFNVAYWNLMHRRVSRTEDGVWMVNNSPLIFFHFSGVSPDRPSVFSKHTTRLSSQMIGEANALHEEYVAHVLRNHHDQTRTIPYHYGPKKKALQTMQLRSGATLVGYAYAESGMGQHVRSVAGSILESTASIPFSICNIDPGVMHGQGDSRFRCFVRSDNSFRVNLMCVNADQIRVAQTLLRKRFFAGRYNVGYFAWELPRWPEAWTEAVNAMDEIWAPSQYIEASISAATTKPVVHMPLAIDPIEPSNRSRTQFGIDEKAFVFLFYADCHSYRSRKNPEGVVRAFLKAFRKDPRAPVQLVVKTLGGEYHPHFFDALKMAMQLDPRITIINKSFDVCDQRALINACDCFVTLHRSEGFGLGAAESMWFGKPVISTAYGGCMDFLSEDRSLLVDYELVPLRRGEYPHWERQQWAEPDVGQAAEYMRRVFEDRTFAYEIGQCGQRYVRTYHSFRAIGDRYGQRLSQILNEIGGSSDRVLKNSSAANTCSKHFEEVSS